MLSCRNGGLIGYGKGTDPSAHADHPWHAIRAELAELYPFTLSMEDRRRHMYVVGQTGTGKSTLLKDIIKQDIWAGRGVGYSDPHG